MYTGYATRRVKLGGFRDRALLKNFGSASRIREAHIQTDSSRFRSGVTSSLYTIVMPTSKKSKAKAGKRGAKTTRDSASEKKAKRLEDGFTAAERCAKRLARQSRARRDARDERYLTLGEQVLRNPLIRDLSIRGMNPYKLSELQSVLGLREFYKLLPDVDLKECYFEGAWGFRKDEFWLANWREMTVEAVREEVRDAHPLIGYRRVYPPGKVNLNTLNTKEEIVRAFSELTYVPGCVYMTAVAGAHVLRSVKARNVGEDPKVVGVYLLWASLAGLDLPVIRGLAGKCGKETSTLRHGSRLRAVTPTCSLSWPTSSALRLKWIG